MMLGMQPFAAAITFNPNAPKLFTSQTFAPDHMATPIIQLPLKHALGYATCLAINSLVDQGQEVNAQNITALTSQVSEYMDSADFDWSHFFRSRDVFMGEISKLRREHNAIMAQKISKIFTTRAQGPPCRESVFQPHALLL